MQLLSTFCSVREALYDFLSQILVYLGGEESSLLVFFPVCGVPEEEKTSLPSFFPLYGFS